MKRRWAILLFVAGAALFAALVVRIGPATLLDDLARVGWWFVPVVALFGLAFVAHTGAWAVVLSVEPRRPSLPRLWQIVVSGYAINFLTPVISAGGEPYRVSALAPWIGKRRATGAVILYFMLHSASSLMLWSVAMIIALGAPLATRETTVGAVVVLTVIAGLGTILWRAHRHGGLETVLDLMQRVPGLRRLARRLESRRATLAELDRHITDFSRHHPRRLASALALDVLARAIAAVEIVIIGHTAGTAISYAEAVAITGFAGLGINATFFVPFGLGTWEGSFLAGYALLGLDPGLGLVAGLVTRLRELAWVAAGLALLLLPGRGPAVIPTRSSPAASS